jgi:restriction system protein
MAGFRQGNRLIFLPGLVIIEHMSEESIRIAQYIIIFWPAWLTGVVILLLRAGRRRRRTLGQFIRRGALAAWLLLLPAWILAWFGPQPAPKLLPEPLNSLLYLAGLLGLLAIELAPFIKHLKTLFNLSSVRRLDQLHAIEALNAMPPTEFERLVQAVYQRLGYRVRHVGHSGDHGVDLEIHTPVGKRWVVQCKRWRGSVGESTVRELYGTLLHEGADRAVLVTSAEITPPAETWARGKPIDLVDGRALLVLIHRARRAVQPSIWQRLTNWFSARRSALLPPPICPNCRVTMIARPARSSDPAFRKSFRCANYPACRVVIVRHQ